MGTGHMTVRFDKKDDGEEVSLSGWATLDNEALTNALFPSQLSSAPAPPATEEEARLAAFFNETSNQWEQTHEALSQSVTRTFLFLFQLVDCIIWEMPLGYRMQSRSMVTTFGIGRSKLRLDRPSC